MASVDYFFSVYTDFNSGNTPATVVNNHISKEVFHKVMNQFTQFINVRDTIFIEPAFIKEYMQCSDYEIGEIIEKFDFVYLLNYDPKQFEKKVAVSDFQKFSYVRWGHTVWAELKNGEAYGNVKLLYEIAKSLNRNLITYNNLIDENYLEALRIKEENRGIKLTKEQSHVLSSVEDQCRWWYLPTDDVSAIFSIFGILPDLKEADITEIMDDVQFENKIVVASFTGHTILFGLNAPYILYPDLAAYMDKKDQQTPHVQAVLNKLSKTFGTAAYFEYNNDDEMAASLAWSSKGKFVYGKFTSEGEGTDIFGTQKKAMEVNQKTILKTAKKLGMTPEDILTGLMKQKQKVKYFTQCDWNIEEMLRRYND